MSAYRKAEQREPLAKPDDFLAIDVQTRASQRQVAVGVGGVVATLPFALAGFATEVPWLGWPCLLLCVVFGGYGYRRRRSKRVLCVDGLGARPRVWVDELELQFPIA